MTNSFTKLSCILILGTSVACAKTKSEPTTPPDTIATETAPAPDAPVAEAPAATMAELGKPAPDFTLPSVNGESVSLSSYKGKIVVLEWFNPGCPFVKYAWGQGPFKGKAAWGQDVVWLTVNSSASGKQGHGLDGNKAAASEWTIKHPVLLDESGAVGQSYGAKSTPHMFVVAADGTLAYRGALDNAPLGKVEGTLVNYVAMAVADLQAGKAAATAETQPYGCSVKYAD